MPQTTYPADMAPAIVGQIVTREKMSGRFACVEDIPFGRVVELTADGWRLPQGTTLGKVLAVAPYNPSYPVGGYKAGDQVAFLRAGKCWVEQDGGGSPDASLGAMNVNHSSTTATNRGKLTASSTSTTTGSEISVCHGTEFVKEDSGATMALVEIEFVANAGG